MQKTLKKLDRWLDSNLSIIVLLAVVVILRLPNFFEPYWYGDEGIYLTVGQSINAGKVLYSQIVDHKTPVIYYLARVPGQLEFRLLLLFWMLVSTMAFYQIAKKLLKSFWPTVVSSLVFVVLTTLPWLEGNIPNGELFVMGFVLVAGWIFTHSELWQLAFSDLPQPKNALHLFKIPKVMANTTQSLIKINILKNWSVVWSQILLLIVSGIFLGLAIMTKVPALFDVLAWFVVGWLILTRSFPNNEATAHKFARQLMLVLQHLFVLGIGVLIPIVTSALYFRSLGAGQDYLQFGLLYNFHYAGNWGLPFNNPLLLKIFTLPGKFVIATFIILWLTFFRNKYSIRYQFIASWLVLALFASLLSNRPYPHYFQQLIPPLALLVGLATAYLEKIKTRTKELPKIIWPLGTIGGLLIITVVAFLLIGFQPYETKKYYQNWFKLITHRQSIEEYRSNFNYLMTDNYQAAKFLRENGVNKLFIWGTNPMLYALAKTVPVGRFTVSFHITDIGAYDETMKALEKELPPYIVVMNDERAEFPDFIRFLHNNYLPGKKYQNFSIWKYVGEQHI